MGDWIPCKGHAKFTTTAVKRCWECADATIAALERENRELRRQKDAILAKVYKYCEADCLLVLTPEQARSAAKRGEG